MKICLDISVLNDRQKTGIGVYTYELINELLKTNRTDEFVLFGISTFDTYNYMQNIDFKKFSNVRLKIIPLPARVFRRAFLGWQKIDFPNIERLTGKIDIFHSFNWYLPPALPSTKLVATIFDLTAIRFPDWHHEKTTQLDTVRFQRILKNASMVTTISEHSKKDIQAAAADFGRLNAPVEVIYPAAGKQFKKSRDTQDIKKVLSKYHLDSNFLLSVATLEPRKNLANLVRGYLLSGVSDRLVLVGRLGWKNEEIFDVIKKAGKKIKMTGFVRDEELVCLYQSAKCLIYPSLYEGFGIPVLEAMKCGTPVITSSNSSLPEVAGDAAIFVGNPQDMEQISAAIKIIQEKGLRNTLTEKGFIRAEKFSWAASARKLNDLYHQLPK